MNIRERILLTGHSGFTGRYIVKTAKFLGLDVVCLTDNGTSNGVPIDLMSYHELDEKIQELSPTAIIHLAAISHVQHQPASDFYSINVGGTRNLIQSLLRMKRSPTSCIFASTANLYRTSDSNALREDSEIKPVNDYGLSKKCMEDMLAFWENKLSVIITRPFNYTGIGQSEKFLIPKIVGHYRRRDPLLELGNIKVRRDFSDVRFISEAYLRLAMIKDMSFTVNLCSGRAVSIDDILKICEEITQFSPEIVSSSRYKRENEIMTLRGDPSFMKKMLGFSTRYSIRDTLAWMINEEVS